MTKPPYIYPINLPHPIDEVEGKHRLINKLINNEVGISEINKTRLLKLLLETQPHLDLCRAEMGAIDVCHVCGCIEFLCGHNRRE